MKGESCLIINIEDCEAKFQIITEKEASILDESGFLVIRKCKDGSYEQYVTRGDSTWIILETFPESWIIEYGKDL